MRKIETLNNEKFNFLFLITPTDISAKDTLNNIIKKLIMYGPAISVT